MEQYQQKTHSRLPSLAKAVTQGIDSNRVAQLEQRIHTLSNTIEYQQRQIRRLESALQLLESLVQRK
jgi:flagellar biosynthesis chaperone FliJ